METRGKPTFEVRILPGSTDVDFIPKAVQLFEELLRACASGNVSVEDPLPPLPTYLNRLPLSTEDQAFLAEPGADLGQTMAVRISDLIACGTVLSHLASSGLTNSHFQKRSPRKRHIEPNESRTFITSPSSFHLASVRAGAVHQIHQDDWENGQPASQLQAQRKVPAAFQTFCAVMPVLPLGTDRDPDEMRFRPIGILSSRQNSLIRNCSKRTTRHAVQTKSNRCSGVIPDVRQKPCQQSNCWQQGAPLEHGRNTCLIRKLAKQRGAYCAKPEHQSVEQSAN